MDSAQSAFHPTATAVDLPPAPPAAGVDGTGPSFAELHDAARIIVDRALTVEAELRALPPPLFNGPVCPILQGSRDHLATELMTGCAVVNGFFLPTALLCCPSDVDETTQLFNAVSDDLSRSLPCAALTMTFAMMQLRVERHHTEPREMRQIVRQAREWMRSGEHNAQLALAWFLWQHATFDRFDSPENVECSSWRDFWLLLDGVRPAHALHFLTSLSDSVLLMVPDPQQSNRGIRIKHRRGDTTLVVGDEIDARCDQLWRDVQAAKSSSDEATREQRLSEIVVSFRQWIYAQQQSLPSRLLAATVMWPASSFVDCCTLLLPPMLSDPAVPLHLAERFTFGGSTLLLPRLCRAVCADPNVIPPCAPATQHALTEIIQQIEQRVRAQTDEQLERDAAFEAAAAVCCEIPLTEGSVTYSLVDYLFGRLRRRLLASGSRLCLTPSFRWSDLLNGPVSLLSLPFSVSLRPTVRLLFSHGFVSNHAGQDYLPTLLEATDMMDRGALDDMLSADCDDLTMHAVDWLAPQLSLPTIADPLIDRQPQFLLMEGSSFEEERIRWMESAPGSYQAAQLLMNDASNAVVAETSFNLPSADNLSAPTLTVFRFDLSASPTKFSERMAQLGQIATCFSEPRPPPPEIQLADNDLLRRMEARALRSLSFRPRLDLLRAAASRWYHRCFPQLRAEIEAHLIPDLASIVLSYVTADERVLRALPPPPPLPLPAVGAFAPPRPIDDASASVSTAVAVAFPSFGSLGSSAAATSLSFAPPSAFSFGTQPFTFGTAPTVAASSSHGGAAWPELPPEFGCVPSSAAAPLNFGAEPVSFGSASGSGSQPTLASLGGFSLRATFGSAQAIAASAFSPSLTPGNSRAATLIGFGASGAAGPAVAGVSLLSASAPPPRATASVAAAAASSVSAHESHASS